MNPPYSAAGTALAVALTTALTIPLGAAPATAVSAPEATSRTVHQAERTQTHQPAERRHAPHRSFGERAVRIAAEYRGVPYRSGGTTPRGFDCSGFARFVYGKLHKHIPRSSQEQYDAAHGVAHPRTGDLIFFHSGRGGSVYHVGIYAGRNRVWHSPRPGEHVRKERIWTRYWTAGRY